MDSLVKLHTKFRDPFITLGMATRIPPLFKLSIYTGDGHVTVNATLQMARFPGGYFSHDGKPYYITDYQGNNGFGLGYSPNKQTNK
ncbi:MAG: hypothetical protein K2J63_11245 [Muribaculaceae bacterium]|nr:hypothetical protein [Muribaculaceae bacterium]MDE6795862.1 hypothetical protein [Muribaculaceae bacterium]